MVPDVVSMTVDDDVVIIVIVVVFAKLVENQVRHWEVDHDQQKFEFQDSKQLQSLFIGT